MLASSLRSRRIIRQAFASAPPVCWDTAAPQFSNELTKDDYLRGNGSVSLFIQRIGSVSAMLVV